MKNFFLLTLILILSITAIYGQTAKKQPERKLALKGLKKYTEDYLYSHLNLKRFDDGKISITKAINEIESFYKKNGYILVKVYPSKMQADKSYELFVDEGRIEKIIIHNLNTIHLVQFKGMIDIPEKIYNNKIIDQNLKKLQKEFQQFNITVNVLKVHDHESDIIQLDREFRRISDLGHFDIDFLSRYPAHNDLHFFVDRKAGKSQGKKDGTIEFKLHFNFPSTVIPHILYNKDHVFFEKDYFKSDFSIGHDFDFYPLISKSPSFTGVTPHEMSFAELKYEYKTSLLDNDFWGPLINGKIYRTHSSRGDLGIIRFDYSYIKTVLAPEFTLLNNLNIYAGLGIEKLWIHNTIIDYEKDRYLDIGNSVVNSKFSEVRLKFDPIKIMVGNKIDRYI
jgi:hypothetical protein